MEQSKIRAWWSHRQGLDGSMAASSSAEVLERTGWARSVGGVGPYLTLFARNGATREQVDVAISRAEIHELPSARGCTYVLPASDFALGLMAGDSFSNVSEMNTARKLGVTDAEIKKLSDAIVKALAKSVLDPAELRLAVGKSVRSLGEEGKKKGLTTTLPLALGQLQTSGAIRRVPTNGRIDQQRYRYALWQPNPLTKFRLSAEQVQSELARRFFRWIGPATMEEFRWFSGFGVKVSNAAVESLKLLPLEEGNERLLFAEDKKALDAFERPKEAQYVLVPSVDAMFLLRRDVRSMLASEDLKQKVFGEKGFHEVGSVMDLPHHAILDRGRLVGLWEYDTTSESIAWSSFGIKDRKLEAAVKRTEAYIRDQLGDARSFSLDSPKSRVQRVDALRKG